MSARHYWFRADEAALFFADRAKGASDFALRPERLRIEPADDSGLELVSQLHCGAYSESNVRHPGSPWYSGHGVVVAASNYYLIAKVDSVVAKLLAKSALSLKV